MLIDTQNTKELSSVELLCVEIYHQLNFNLHMSNICKSASNQMSAMIIRKKYLSSDSFYE